MRACDTECTHSYLRVKSISIVLRSYLASFRNDLRSKIRWYTIFNARSNCLHIEILYCYKKYILVYDGIRMIRLIQNDTISCCSLWLWFGTTLVIIANKHRHYLCGVPLFIWADHCGVFAIRFGVTVVMRTCGNAQHSDALMSLMLRTQLMGRRLITVWWCIGVLVFCVPNNVLRRWTWIIRIITRRYVTDALDFEHTFVTWIVC